MISFISDIKPHKLQKRRKLRLSKQKLKLGMFFKSNDSSNAIYHNLRNPNIQSDEANFDNSERTSTREDDNGNWIPYDDHRNAVEHGSGDIILLLEDADETKSSINKVMLFYYL